MGTYVAVDEATGVIVNRIVLDDPDQWEVPAGHLAFEETGEAMAIGGSFIDGVYAPPVQPDPPLMPPAAPSPETTVLYDHENRLRAIEGEPPLTLQDFFTKMRP